MKNKKAKFSPPRKTLVLLQQLQTKYFNTVDVSIYVLGINAFSAGIGMQDTRIFFSGDTAEERESKYNELLTLINDRL